MQKKYCNVLIVIILLMISIASCRPPQIQKYNINYLQGNADSSHAAFLQNYDTKIQPGDKLNITISSLNPAAASIYSPAGSGGGSGSGTPGPGGGSGSSGNTLVDNNGQILMPQLGMITAAGLTRNELRDTLLKRLSVYLTDPIVAVDFANFRITVLGAVSTRGTYGVAEGHINIWEALGKAGDITPDGQRDSVMVIRESNGKREFGQLNLLSYDVFKSPYYVLQQNDVVYVPLNKKKAIITDKEEKKVTLQTIATIVSVLTSVVVLILNFNRN